MSMTLRLSRPAETPLARVRAGCASLLHRARTRAQALPPETWFLLAFVLLGLAFLLALLLAPTAGRGGR